VESFMWKLAIRVVVLTLILAEASALHGGFFNGRGGRIAPRKA
jgi:hypothetical protein